MSDDRYYCARQENGLLTVGTIVAGARHPMFRDVSEDNARQIGRGLMESGIELGSEFAIDCTTIRRRYA
ncbi:MAG: hypothetical protein M9945_14390 [Aquamicrobium sp.]|uniref:hypothetical protein n=1 Tax=Aquamicrobium sp. TaxID=1872579 RepID=UPI00349EAB23|nr:hypothetical protein [Aquamicrobium sp.]